MSTRPSLVDDANGIRALVVPNDDLLEPVKHHVVVPLELAEEFLQRPWRNACT